MEESFSTIYVERMKDGGWIKATLARPYHANLLWLPRRLYIGICDVKCLRCKLAGENSCFG